MYDLVDQWPGFSTTPRRVTDKDVDLLARLDTRYYDRGGTDTDYQTRRTFETEHMRGSMNMLHDVDVPTHRTEYVSTGDYMVDDDTPRWETCLFPTVVRAVYYNCGPERTYDTGASEDVSWQNGAHMGVYSGWRSSGLTFAEFGFSEGSHQSKLMGAYSDPWISASADGQNVFTGEANFGWIDVPDDATDFVVEGGYTMDQGLYSRDIVMSSRWVFHMDRPDPNLGSVSFPLLDIDYRPHIDLSGTAPAGQDLPVDLTVLRTNRADPTPVPVDLIVEYSPDRGRSWSRAEVTVDDGDRYHVTVPADAVVAGGTVSFRVSARAADGSRVDQTALGMVAVAGG